MRGHAPPEIFKVSQMGFPAFWEQFSVKSKGHYSTETKLSTAQYDVGARIEGQNKILRGRISIAKNRAHQKLQSPITGRLNPLLQRQGRREPEWAPGHHFRAGPLQYF